LKNTAIDESIVVSCAPRARYGDFIKRRTSMRLQFLTVALAVAGFCSSLSGEAQTPAPAAVNPLDAIPENMPFDVPYGAPISLDRAEAAIAAAVAEAKKHHWKLNVAVVDSGVNLVAFQRMDGAQLASIAVSEHKARAAASFRRETRAFEDAIQLKQNYYVLSLDGIIASRGGIPLIEAGKIIGAIGCSGGTGSQDEVACKAGAATIK
jgi:glc operon protein GlcG